MPRESYIREAFSFANLYLSSGIRDQADGSKAKGALTIAMIRDRSFSSGLTARVLGVARFSRFAKEDIHQWDGAGFRSSLVNTVSRHLLLGARFSKVIQAVPKLLGIFENSIPSGSFLNSTTGLAIGVCGMDGEGENQIAAEYIMEHTLEYLGHLVASRSAESTTDAQHSLQHYRWKMFEKYNIELENWRLPLVWPSPKFWKHPAFVG